MKTLLTVIFLVAPAFAAAAVAQDRAATVAQPAARAAAQPLTAGQIESIALAVEPPQGISRQLRQELDRIAELYRQGRHDEATSRWIRMAQPHAGKGKEGGKEWIEIESWANYVLHRAFIQPDAGLRARAAAVRSAGMRHEATHVVQQTSRPARPADDSRRATVELQTALQERQKTYTTLSNVMKTLHDTAKSAIRNTK
jgi:hypothetical protein